ncbi:hypothetical protein [Streptomyces sp. NPDC051994]|uniref:hypothetical protein n=1 Tax=unclassified Streptomyces TaxID=2593676 RepID=UPI0034486611
MHRHELLEHLRTQVDYTTREHILMGDLDLAVHATVSPFPANRYFSRTVRAATPWATATRRHHYFWMRPEDLAEPVLGEVTRHADRGFRAERFRDGFYLTHHHGAPALLFVTEDATYVIGGDPSKVFWSYFVKVALTRHAHRSGRLHLKAGAIVAEDRTLLVVGRGGGGKTFLSLLASGAGATFVSNTHVLLAPDSTIGVTSSIRVRPDPAYDWLFARAETSPHFEGRESVIDPVDAGFRLAPSAGAPDAIVILDHSGRGDRSVEPVTPREARALVDHFAWPLNTYGMKYDVWDMVGGSLNRFSDYLDSESEQLDKLCGSVPALRVDWHLSGVSDVAALMAAVVGHC